MRFLLWEGNNSNQRVVEFPLPESSDYLISNSFSLLRCTSNKTKQNKKLPIWRATFKSHWKQDCSPNGKRKKKILSPNRLLQKKKSLKEKIHVKRQRSQCAHNCSFAEEAYIIWTNLRKYQHRSQPSFPLWHLHPLTPEFSRTPMPHHVPSWGPLSLASLPPKQIYPEMQPVRYFMAVSEWLLTLHLNKPLSGELRLAGDHPNPPLALPSAGKIT